MTVATVIRPRRRVFPGADSQVGRARLFVGDVLDGCPVADDAVLLTASWSPMPSRTPRRGTAGRSS